VTFEAELRRELARCGIDARRSRRIIAELRDHAACDARAELGPPKLIAERFADELRVAETRRATRWGFVALAATAFLLMAAAGASGASSPSGLRGAVAVVAALGIVVACQVAFVGGVLALWLLPGAGRQVGLVQRRMRVGLLAAEVAVGCLGVQQAVAGSGGGWRVGLAVAAIAAAAAVLVPAAIVLRRASMLVGAPAPAPSGLPWWFVVGTGVLVCSVLTVGSGYAESSATEGLIRGAFEALAFAGGFLLLGRYLGLRPAKRHESVPTLRQ
jgi:hypothetical protein